MTERENMQLVWEHKQPEWVPMITKASQMLISPEINDRPLFQDGKDWFGLQWELDKKHPELMTHVAPGRYVLEDISDWREHIVFPSCREINWDMVAGRTKAMWAKRDEMMGYVVYNIGAFERLLSTMGVENALLSFYTDIDALADYANAYADYRIEQMEYFKKYMNADFLMMHDDWGNQTNLFMSPEQWRAVFKEPERRMVQRCHELGMYYMHHSCGKTEAVIGDLVEIGVDSWHSVQPMNDLAGLKAAYGDRLIFAGGVDPQVTDRPGATEAEIRADVRRVIDTLGKGGGLLCSSAVMFSTVPGVDGIIEDEGSKYGQYKNLNFAS